MSENQLPDGQTDPDAIPARSNQRNIVIVLGVLLLAAIAWILFLLFGNGGGTPPGASSSPASSTAGSSSSAMSSMSASTSASSASSSSSITSSAPASSSATATQSGTLPAAEAKHVVWPDPKGTQRFTSPDSATQSFAEDLVGFEDPILSEFQQGDSRSGEIVVTKEEGMTATSTVMVRQMSDNKWYVIGAASSEINVTAPDAGATVTTPVHVAGTSRAFEAVVVVKVMGFTQSGDVSTVTEFGSDNVMGSSGPDLGPFSGDIAFAQENGSPQGSVLFVEYSAKDGNPYVVAAVPVSFE